MTRKSTILYLTIIALLSAKAMPNDGLFMNSQLSLFSSGGSQFKFVELFAESPPTLAAKDSTSTLNAASKQAQT